MGEPLGRCLLVVRLIQLLPDSQIVARHARYGSGDHGSRLGYRRVANVGVRSLPGLPKSILELPRTSGRPTVSRAIKYSRSPDSGDLLVLVNIRILAWRLGSRQT